MRTTLKGMDLTVIAVEDLTKEDGIELLHVWGNDAPQEVVEEFSQGRKVLEIII